MKIRIRMLAFGIIAIGAGLLGTPEQASSTMLLDPIRSPDNRRFCCAVDTNGDRRGDTWCCYSSGCRIDAQGCIQAT